jgi:hypothetical protein
MSESRHKTISDHITRSMSPRRLSILLCVVVFAIVGTIGGIRVWVLHAQEQIHALGGTTMVGPPPIYYTLKGHRWSPQVIQQFLKSDTGHWVFSRFPVVYRVDLRGVRDEAAIESALQLAKNCSNIRELVLYKSAVTDKHLKILRGGFSRLESLKINETGITDRGIAELRHLSQLRLLNAQRTLITNAAVPDLIAIPRLKELSIAETQITDGYKVRKAHRMCVVNDRLVTLEHTTDFYHSSGN